MNANDIPLSWKKCSSDIYIKANDLALQSQNGSTVNAFYNPEAGRKIKDLMQILPLWTGVMRPHFKRGTEIATSSSVESCFAEYKSKLFKGTIPMRIDKFIIHHFNYLDGRMRLDFADNDFSFKELHKTDKSDSSIDMSLNSTNSEHQDNFNASNSNIISDSSYICDTKDSKTSSTISESESINESDDIIRSLNFEEDWMGLTKKNAKKFGSVKRHTYL